MEESLRSGRRLALAGVLALAVTLAVVASAPAGAAQLAANRYVVVLAGTQGAGGFVAVQGTDAALAAVRTAGGTVLDDLSRQIGVLVVTSPRPSFQQALGGSPLVKTVGRDFKWQGSTELKCNSDPVQRSFRRAVERAIAYARSRGVTPVAALGNSDEDLAHASAGDPVDCDVVPAETPGVVGVVSLGPKSEKASYSNYGWGKADVAAPGGNGETGDCTTTILSTFPAGTYACIQGTSMASPHVARSRRRRRDVAGCGGQDPPVDRGRHRKAGYDECFGNGRVDALRAATNNTRRVVDASAPYCPEYDE